MAISQSDNIATNAPKPTDARYGPWTSVAAAKAGVPADRRFDGLTVQITGLGEYHWLAGDLSDDGLVAKTLPGGGGGGGGNGGYIGKLTPTPISAPMIQSDGSVRIPVPNTATDLLDLNVTQTSRGISLNQPITTFVLVPGELRIGSTYGLVVGDIITGHYYVEEGTAPEDNPFNLSLVSIEGLVEGDVTTDEDGNTVQEYLVDKDGFWDDYIGSFSGNGPITSSQIVDFNSAVDARIAAYYAPPAAPITPVVNDTSDTFGWTDTGGKTFTDAEYSINSGSTWTSSTANPQPIGNLSLATGAVQVRYKASGAKPASTALSSTAPFTAGASGYTTPTMDLLVGASYTSGTATRTVTGNGSFDAGTVNTTATRAPGAAAAYGMRYDGPSNRQAGWMLDERATFLMVNNARYGAYVIGNGSGPEVGNFAVHYQGDIGTDTGYAAVNGREYFLTIGTDNVVRLVETADRATFITIYTFPGSYAGALRMHTSLYFTTNPLTGIVSQNIT